MRKTAVAGLLLTSMWSADAVAERCQGPCLLLKQLPKCDFTVDAAFDTNTIFPRGNSDRYTPASEPEQSALYLSIRAAIRGDREAWGLAFEAGYILCARPEVSALVWRPALPATGGAILALRTKDARPVIFEVPHPLYDGGTLKQGRFGFDEMTARALLVSGTHRCANAAPAPCGGTTRVCSGRLEPYRESDVAHAVDSMFHTAHRALADEYTEDNIVSLHAMADDGISLSDGTSIATSSASTVAALLFAFEDEFESELVTGCNEAPWASQSDHLCGTTNVQGRYANGLPDRACVETATRSTGRFFHLEQSAAVRRNYRRVTDVIMKTLAPRRGKKR